MARARRGCSACRTPGSCDARVLLRVVDALAGVLDVEDLVAERAQPEQVHQRAPGHAAERISGDDAGEEDLHTRVPSSARRPIRARRAIGRRTGGRTSADTARSTPGARRACPARRAGPRAAPGSASASRIVDSRCAITIVVRPSRRRRSASKTISSEIASSDEVGSSRIRIGAFLSSARAMPRRWRSPPDSVAPASATGVS